MMRTVTLSAGQSASDWGRAHGESFRYEIQKLAELRLYLCRTIGGFKTDADVLDCAGAHLSVLADYDRELSDELLGIAEAANASPELVVVLNHYTDLRDLGPAARMTADAGGCSVIYHRDAPDDGTDGDGNILLGQTWDMHATAMPYAAIVKTPDAALLSLTGCLGMAGMNRWGVAVAINNLRSVDAKIGIVWSALVRRLLKERTASAAFAVLESSPIGSGHHYVVADAKDVFAVETSGTLCKTIYRGAHTPYVHTNHCIDPDVARCSHVPPTSTTHARYDWLTTSLTPQQLTDAAGMWQVLGSQDGFPASICTNVATPQKPHATATCSAVVMDIAQRRILAAAGFPNNVAPTEYRLE